MARNLSAVLVLLASIGASGCATLREGTELGPVELDAGQTLDRAPVPVTIPRPVYPAFARDANITGTVLLHVRIGEDGRPHEIDIVHGITGLNEAAVDAARHSAFQPALRDGQPASAWVSIPVAFRY